MINLESRYLGIDIRNPLVLGSSGLSATVEGVRKAYEAGVGAVVLKSLFEEQLIADASSTALRSDAAESLDKAALLGEAGAYIDLIHGAKKAVDIPIIASINCVSGEWWPEFARHAEAAGANALELNVGIQPSCPEQTALEIENRILAIVRSVHASIRLPFAVKIGSSYTNPGNLIAGLVDSGASGVVLFNRFYRLDVDLNTLSLAAGPSRSRPEDFHETLRWIARLFGRVRCDLIASGGVHDADNVLKMIAVGASSVQLCSAVYTSGYHAITAILERLTERLGSLGIKSASDLRGRLSRFMSDDPAAYDRLQYVKALTGIS